jgi:hypothetical protein
MYKHYNNLPIVQIDSWETFDMNNLKPLIKDYKDNKLFANTEELTIDFYINKIFNFRNTL